MKLLSLISAALSALIASSTAVLAYPPIGEEDIAQKPIQQYDGKKFIVKFKPSASPQAWAEENRFQPDHIWDIINGLSGRCIISSLRNKDLSDHRLSRFV
jgi:hypothetical protein